MNTYAIIGLLIFAAILYVADIPPKIKTVLWVALVAIAFVVLVVPLL